MGGSISQARGMETELVPGTQAATAASHNIFMLMLTACMHVCLDADLSRVEYPKVNAGSNGEVICLNL